MLSQSLYSPYVWSVLPSHPRLLGRSLLIRGGASGAEFVGEYFSRFGGEPREVMTVLHVQMSASSQPCEELAEL